MPGFKRIVCLANSRKLHGRCIAGREYNNGRAGSWVRPVSTRPHEEVSEYERQYEDGSDPQVLDIICVPLLERRPRDFQQENWLLDSTLYWRREGRLQCEDLGALVEMDGPLWLNGHSTFSGTNDRIPLELAQSLRTSLRLIYVESLVLAVCMPGQAFGNSKRRVQAQFKWAGVFYRLWVTDPRIERHYLAMADGRYPLDECYLTISLGEPHNDACYKLVAAIIERKIGDPS